MPQPPMSAPVPGKLVIVSGPSGAGKTTVLHRVLALCPLPLVPSVSATTRRPRAGEVDGRDYYFLSEEEFARRRAAGDFLESCQVFSQGDWYGTLTTEVSPRIAAGKWVVLEIDVQGTLAVLEKHPEALTIFVRPDTVGEIESRLRQRQTENEAAIERRLETALRELREAERYQHVVINRDVGRAALEICEILTCAKGT